MPYPVSTCFKEPNFQVIFLQIEQARAEVGNHGNVELGSSYFDVSCLQQCPEKVTLVLEQSDEQFIFNSLYFTVYISQFIFTFHRC